MGLDRAVQTFWMVKTGDRRSNGVVGSIDVVGVAFERDPAERVQARCHRRLLLVYRRN